MSWFLLPIHNTKCAVLSRAHREAMSVKGLNLRTLELCSKLTSECTLEM